MDHLSNRLPVEFLVRDVAGERSKARNLSRKHGASVSI